MLYYFVRFYRITTELIHVKNKIETFLLVYAVFNKSLYKTVYFKELYNKIRFIKLSKSTMCCLITQIKIHQKIRKLEKNFSYCKNIFFVS